MVLGGSQEGFIGLDYITKSQPPPKKTYGQFSLWGFSEAFPFPYEVADI